MVTGLDLSEILQAESQSNLPKTTSCIIITLFDSMIYFSLHNWLCPWLVVEIVP